MKCRPMNICEQTLNYPSGNKETYYTICFGKFGVFEDLNMHELLRLQRLINSVASKHTKKGGLYNER